jgi:hypothetical protein
MILRDFAHARTGDKGDTALISVICHDPRNFARVRDALSPQRVQAAFAGLVRGPVTRHEVPALGALVFVLEKALSGGVSTSLSADPHGKSLASVLLALEIDTIG